MKVNNASIEKGLWVRLDIDLDLEQDGRLVRVVDNFEVLEAPAKGAKKVLCRLRNQRCNLLVPIAPIRKGYRRKLVCAYYDH